MALNVFTMDLEFSLFLADVPEQVKCALSSGGTRNGLGPICHQKTCSDLVNLVVGGVRSVH